ncbi:hypothetical protein PR048_011621 [Dryococelus australis]|uniref:Uncharacterized protein n=1 Tax=Dryococelus australis TaxID=614101 RepID=A0ABQ9HM37_9NEOP|nr:hypothetical protein PR048_011621 [Dryococelus australis]
MQTVLPAVCDFSFLCFFYLWENVLEEVNHTKKIPTEYKINEIVKLALQFATKTCEEMDIPLVKRKTTREKKMISGEKAQNVPLILNAELKRSMWFEYIDRFFKKLTLVAKTWKLY